MDSLSAVRIRRLGQTIKEVSIGESRIVRLNKVSYLCIVNLNILIMVQGKKQLSSKPKFAEVVIGDNEAKDMRESDVDKKAELRPNR